MVLGVAVHHGAADGTTIFYFLVLGVAVFHGAADATPIFSGHYFPPLFPPLQDLQLDWGIYFYNRK